jgi:site-specific recombinase XerD
LDASNPAHAAVTALIAFHALRPGQVQRLHLTDVRDGTLHLDGRPIPLAEPVQQALTAYLNHRQTRWPYTSNPYLFVTMRTASSDAPVSRRWVWQALGPKLSAADVRQDRIIDETHATGGDVRRLADLLGLSVKAGSRYTATVDHPDLTALT